ncbi:MAG: hypothetical protein SGJ18_05945 [Pseudomonadota bacterium]|nr:hypothetical protein [Pseudomonadota bacterium]
MKRQFLVFIVVLISAMDFAWAEEKSSLSFFDRVKSKMERIVVEAKDKAREVKREIVQWYNGFRVDENKAEKTEKTEVAQSPESIAPVVPSAPIEIPTAQPQDLKEVVKNMKSSGGLSVETPARAGDKNLKRNKQGVVSLPKFIKNIPHLDIGDEERLSYTDLIGDKINVKPLTVKPFAKLSAPELVAKNSVNAVIPKKIEPVVDAGKNISQVKGQDFPVTQQKIEAVSFTSDEPQAVQELALKLLSASDKTLLAAIMMNATGKACHNVVGLLRDVDVNHSGYAEAKFMSAECLREMGLGSQKLNDLKEVLSQSDKEFGSLAIGRVGEDAQFSYEGDVGQMIKTGQMKFGVNDSDKDAVSFTMAKIYTRDGQYDAAIREATVVKSKSEYYSRAQFIIMMSQYLQGNSKASLETGKQLSQYLNKNGDPQKLATMVNMNMGRIYANGRSYDESLKNYLKVEKNHPQWVEGLLEQGWVQLHSGDYVGAVGNMFSIQTGFFRNVYKPESYAVRTIGYLNICQYGDAYRTIEVFEKIHRPWFLRVEDYLKTNTKLSVFYDTLKKHLKDPKQTMVDGLPFQIVREMGRHKDFLNLQEGINELIDEVDQWSYIEKFFVKDLKQLNANLKQFTIERQGLLSKVTKLQANKTQTEEVANIKRTIKQYEVKEGVVKFRLEMVARAQTNFGAAKKEVTKLISLRKNEMKGKAERVLAKRLKSIRDNLKELFANNDLLRFEVFSGSGENIRFQVAGGEKGLARTPASLKENAKNLNWDFDGEIWEDEIGNFRSSLQNNCPKEKSRNAGL